MKSAKKLALLIPFVLFICTGNPVFAGKVIPLSISKITKAAEFVFEGKCIEIKTGKDDESGMIATWFTFEVIQPIKGKLDKTFTFKQLGGSDQHQIMNVPITKYEKDEHIILFLYPKSEIGFTSSVGMHQGKFNIRENSETGVQYVTNGMPGMTLFENLNQMPASINAKGVKAFGTEPIRSERFDKEEFIQFIEQLVEEQKTEKQ